MIGLLPLARHEGILLVRTMGRDECLPSPVVRRAGPTHPAGSLQYDLIPDCRLPDGSLPAAVYLTPKPTDFYGSGGWLHYGMPLLAGVGKPVALLAMLAIPAILRSPRARLFLAWDLIYVAMHVVIVRFASSARVGMACSLMPISF
jgi:hypothetical protein